jgi:heptaprenyl diphosphate synthase
MKSFWDGQPEISRDLEEVRETITRCTATDNADVHAAIGQLLSAGGKMLRPAFVLLASRFGNPDRSRIIRIGAAVEMLHMATLVHDDIIDSAPFRRGVATLNATRGPRTAVLVGDWLFASCFTLIADIARTENARALSLMVARICASEIGQSADRFVVHTSRRRYLRRITGKTAALFALAFYVGAVESGCTGEICARLRRLGYCLGICFQIVDDILDFSPAAAQIGKPTGSDLRHGVLTLPTILALRSDDGSLAKILSRGVLSRRAATRASRMIAVRGGIEAARDEAEVYTRRARRELSRLAAVPAAAALEEIAERLLHRTW